MAVNPLKFETKLHVAPTSGPKFSSSIKDASGQDVILADPRATRALVALMDLQAVNGGAASHWGGPAALAEAMSALHAIMFKDQKWFEKYNFVNDVGHGENGIYALRANLGYGDLSLEDLKGFRSISSKLTGHGECHLYPEGVLLSNGPLGSSVGQAQGLAMADKLAGNNRVTINVVSDGASMEGEAKEAFAAIPGFAKKGKLNSYLLIISDNNTKLSGRIDGDSFSMGPSFDAMESLGWKVIDVKEGNDLQACYSAIEDALKNISAEQPICLRLKTVKGYGVKSTEEHGAGGHGFPIKAFSEDIHNFIQEIWGEELPAEFKSWASDLTQKPESKKSDSYTVAEGAVMEKAQAGFARAAISAVEEGIPVVSISSDLQGSTGMAAFHKAHPERSFDVGIAEANMVSVGAGFAKQGYVPIVDTFSAFGVTKGNLPLIMASLSSAPVICVFSHTGFQDAADGASHQSLTYISAVSSIPNTNVICVSTSSQAEAYLEMAIEQYKEDMDNGVTPKSTVFFVGRENFPSYPVKDVVYQWGTPQVIKEGSDVVIAGCGPTLFKALHAAELLEKEGVKATVVDQAFVNNFDVAEFSEILKQNNFKLITVEDHQIIGGMGAQLAHQLKQAGAEFKLASLGVDGSFGQSAYKADELYAKHGLDASSIISKYKNL